MGGGGGRGTPKNKTKTILFFAVPFSPTSTSIKLIPEYTHMHAYTTACLKEKNISKNMGCTLATQPLQKSQVSSSR